MNFSKGHLTRKKENELCNLSLKCREKNLFEIFYALLIMPKPLTVWITINCGEF